MKASNSIHRLAAGLVLAACSTLVLAQGTQVPFGGLSHDATLPVEITSNQLQLDQGTSTAVFSGSVIVGQGEMRIASDTLEVFYQAGEDGSTGQVNRMQATGNVTLTNGVEAAESDKATYDVATGIVEMQGNVLMTQGGNALSSDKMRINLNDGTGVLDGRVQTIFQPGTDQ